MADDSDLNTQVERTLTHVARIIVLTLKSPLLVGDLFRKSTLTSMMSDGGAERRYLGPQSLLVAAFLLRVGADYLPQPIEIFERKLVMPASLERERFHYLLEFFLWFGIFSVVRTIVARGSGLTGRERKLFEQLLGYATALPLIAILSVDILNTLSFYFGWQEVKGLGGVPDINFSLLAVTGLAFIGATVIYPVALFYRASASVLAHGAPHSRHMHPSMWKYWRVGLGTAAALTGQVAFAWSPTFIERILPPTLSMEILDMYLTSRPTSPTTFQIAMSLKISNRSSEDVFVETSDVKLWAAIYGEATILTPPLHKEFARIGKESSEVIVVKRSIQAPEKANLWTVWMRVTPASSTLLISNTKPFLFWPPAEKCFSDDKRTPC